MTMKNHVEIPLIVEDVVQPICSQPLTHSSATFSRTAANKEKRTGLSKESGPYTPLVTGGFSNKSIEETHRRILVIDDNAAIHDDFLKILASRSDRETLLSETEEMLLGQEA